MPGLVPGISIHDLDPWAPRPAERDGRDKPGHDD
jgi:hypothetical protein